MDVPSRRGRSSTFEAAHGTAGSVLHEGEQRYRRLLDVLPVAVYTCEAPSGAITYFNDRAAALWGRTPRIGDAGERFCGSFRRYRPDGQPMAHDQTPMAITLADGRAFRNEEVIIEQPTGARIAVRVSIDPIRDADGRVVGAVNVFQDTTGLEEARAQLHATERRFREMIDALPAAVYTTDAEGRLTHFNPGAAALAGRQPRIGIDRWTVFHRTLRPDGTVLPDGEYPLAVALRDGRALQYDDLIGERPDGTRAWCTAYPSPLHDAAGAVIGGINMLVDVTERRRAEQARAHLAAIVDSSDDAIVGKDLDGTITSWNGAAERLFGYPAADAIGRSIAIIIPPDRLAEEVSMLERIRRGERIQHYETIRRRRDGTLLEISLTLSPIRDAHGRVVGASKIARDITARRLADRERLEEALVRETLARVSAALAAELDHDKLVHAIVDAGTVLTGAECGAFARRPSGDAGEPLWLQTICGGSREAFTAFLQPRAGTIFDRVFRGEGPVRIDDVGTDAEPGRAPGAAEPPSSDPSFRSCLAVPVLSRSGEIPGGLIFVHSQAGRFLPRHEQLGAGLASSAAIALDNARLYAEAQEANRLKDEFLATLSHELRTPLNAMLGWSHMLRAGGLPPDTQRRALESLERNARAQAQLVEDLLDVSRIVNGKLRIRFEDVDLARVVLDAADAVRPAAAAKGIDLQVAVERDPSIVVRGDADRLRQIAWNLLSNATKFTPSGGRVRVDLDVAGAVVRLVVRDTGEGIPPAFLRHVFDRFRQAEGTVGRRHGGLGLGLAIVKHLAESHGGTVAADSPGEGLGATFTVTLPLRAVREHPPARVRPRPARRALAGARILVVDDQPDARDLARVVLEMEGAEVTTVSSAGEALHALAHDRFDVLISDIGMPDRNGYSLIQAVRSLHPDRGGAIPAIAATAYASVRERAKALEAGFGWHLAKPVDPEQLVAAAVAARGQNPRGRSARTGPASARARNE